MVVDDADPRPIAGSERGFILHEDIFSQASIRPCNRQSRRENTAAIVLRTQRRVSPEVGMAGASQYEDAGARDHQETDTDCWKGAEDGLETAGAAVQ